LKNDCHRESGSARSALWRSSWIASSSGRAGHLTMTEFPNGA
jgi:hypothetical protein